MLHDQAKELLRSALERETIYVPANKLCVKWTAAQRTIDRDWVQLIIENWNRDLFDDLLVAGPDEDGMYHVVEGMHRTEVVQQKFGFDVMVPCRLVSATSSPEAALIWSLVCKSKKPARQVELFDIKVEAEDIEAKQIHRILAECGLRIGKASVLGGIQAVTAIQRIYRTKSTARPTVGGVLRDVMTVIVNAWGHDPKAYSALLLRGVTLFIQSYPNARHARLVEVMKGTTPGQLSTKVKLNRMTRNVAHYVCEELVMQYNYKLPVHTRLKLDEIKS